MIVKRNKPARFGLACIRIVLRLGVDMAFETEYVDPDDLDVLPVREKAKRHLKTWTKKQLVDHLVMSAKDGWIGKWAEEYDEAKP